MPPRRRNSSQQQQPAQAGAVYGPRSALTSFLREQGITGATASQFRPRTGQRLDTQPPPEQDQDQDQVDPTAANADAGPSTSSSTATPVTAATTTTAAKKRKLKKPEGVDEDGFRLGGSQLPAPAPKKGRYEHRPVGSFAVCAECGKKFTVSKYTASNPNAEVGGVLCQPCTSESIEERASFPGANSGASTPKRPKVQKKKSQRGVDETLFTPIPTLQQACLALVSQYIHSVEALGDLGPKNLDKVSKIVAKNRALDDLNLKLFLDVGHREIKLYDCTKITDRALASISTFAPHLTHLTLLQCGRLDDDVLTAWSHPLTGFKDLRHLTLYAPYLVRAEKWKEFFEGIGGADEKGEGEGEGVVTKKRPELETFQLRMSSRFNDEALAAFVKHNPHVVHLQLSELGKLTSSSLSLLHPLARSSTTMIAPSSDSDSDSVPILRTLDLSRLGTPQGQVLVDKDLIALLATGLGAGLERLVLDGNALLTERSLTEGVRRYCHRLRELSLSDCEGIKGEGVEAMFTGRWPGEEGEEEEEEVGGDEGDVAMNGAEAEEGGQQNGGGAAGDATAATSAAAAAAVVVVDGDKDQVNNKDGAEHSRRGAEPDATATAAAAADDDDADEEEDLPLFEPGRPWRSPGLTLLNLHRLTTVNPSTLSALMAHSAHSLEYLNLHSCDELDSNALMETLADKAKKVQVVDLSFVRAVDNFVVQRLLERCEGLRVLFLHGNNRVTSDVPRKRGVHLRGLENAFYSEVPAGVPWEQ